MSDWQTVPGGMADVFGIRGQDGGNIEVLGFPAKIQGDGARAHSAPATKPPLLGVGPSRNVNLGVNQSPQKCQPNRP